MTFLNADYGLLRINENAVKAFGLEWKNVIGRKCYEVLGDPGSSGPCQECPVKTTLETKKQTRSGRRITDERFIELTSIPVLDENGEITKIVGVSHDVTEQKHYFKHLRSCEGEN